MGNRYGEKKMSRRTSLFLILLALCLLIGILFRDFVRDNFVTPIAVMLLVFWRIALSVDQKYYWGALILAAGLYALYCLQAQRPAVVDQTRPPDANTSLENVNHWRTWILLTSDELRMSNILKRDLGRLLVAMYALKQPGTSSFEIHKALYLRQIPLPEHIYAFLFPAVPSDSRRSLSQILQTVWQTPGEWVRRWTGRDVAEYYESIEDVLTILESALEIKHDEENLDNRNH
jgi:hypothetical protein